MAELDWQFEAIPDDHRFSHILSFSDWIAHEREDLVDRACSFVGEMGGVDQALHEDREVILISAPGLSLQDLAAPFTAWWDDVKGGDPPWEDLLKRQSSAAHGVLKSAGFKKRNHTFNRQTAPDVWQAIEVRRLDDGTARIEIGIYVDGVSELLDRPVRRAWITEVECHIRDPLGGRHYVPLSADSAEITELMTDVIVPGLERLKTREDLRAASGDGRHKLGMRRPANVVIACLAALDNDRSTARAVLQQTFDDANRHARPGILALGERLGLEPLITGVDATLSTADEETLAWWSSTHQARLDELQRLVDRFPLDRRLFALGRRKRDLRILPATDSMDLLWQWLVARVSQLPDLVERGAEVPPRYVGYAFQDLTEEEKVLAELLSAYMFEAVRESVREVVWGFDMGGAIAIRGAKAETILSRGQQIMAWLSEPPVTVADPRRANMLADRVRWLIDELS